jgi:flavorubredoxin
MQITREISRDTYYVGGSDRRIALFENIYPVSNGVSYNSYVILDEKTALLDTVDNSIRDLFFENLEKTLNGRKLDYLIINHMEPDHASSIEEVVLRHPEVTLVLNNLTLTMVKNFFRGLDVSKLNVKLVKEFDVLDLGSHKLTFVMAPMVHWPEVMFTYDTTTKTLFSADAFGTFGALHGHLYMDQSDFEHVYLYEFRRYFLNIVGTCRHKEYKNKHTHHLQWQACLPYYVFDSIHYFTVLTVVVSPIQPPTVNELPSIIFSMKASAWLGK